MIIILWWIFLFSISILNILYMMLQYPKINTTFIYKMYLLAFIYVIVNSIRAIWLRIDIERICFFDSILSSPLFGRIIATIAEICYILLILLIYNKIINRIYHNNNLTIILYIILLGIFLAELLSWKGCLSTNQKFNVLEESIWTLCAFILGILTLIILFNEKNNKIKNLLYIVLLTIICYVIFMITVDIPMYDNRCKNKTQFTSLMASIYDMAKCKKISKDLKDWKEDMAWFTGYFTLGSWSSIGLFIWYCNNKNI